MTLPDGVDVWALVRRFEPVVRYTAGELFFPMSVEAYVDQAALWEEHAGNGGDAMLLVDHGKLDLKRLSAHARANPGTRLELRYAPRPMSRHELRTWRRDPQRPRLKAATRFAAVGLVGRVVDALVRLSLTLRGRVPGGLVAAAHAIYRSSPAAREFPYYAHVSVDGGYVVVQYWLFYAMNDWRSSFAGVNDHESDWEHVSVFLVATDDEVPTDDDGPTDDRVPTDDEPMDGTGGLRPAWVAFSSHDEVGADLRRRVDDPDLIWVDGTHPVVHAGAGSHSGAYLAGDYLVRVEPRSLHRWFDRVAWVREHLFPWTRGSPRTGLGIPYVDYKRGDGLHIGPGTDRPWTPVLIDSNTSWVRDFRGLWGLDTDDPFGGERAPAGPRYERNGAIRESWADPVAWAGLDTIPPTPAAVVKAAAERLDELDRWRAQLDRDISAQQERTRRLMSGLPPQEAEARERNATIGLDLTEQRRRLDELRATRRVVVSDQERLLTVQQARQAVSPHAHLRRRAVPIHSATGKPPGLLLRIWTEASISVLLALFGLSLIVNVAPAPTVVVIAILGVMAVEATLRRRLRYLLLGVAIVAALIFAVVEFVANWRLAVGAAALTASVALAFANLRARMARR